MTGARPASRLLAALPNALSILRLGLAAAFPLSIEEWRLPIVVAGGLSDWLDGFIARRYGARSGSGVLLDAIADKLFVGSVLVTLAWTGLLAWWQLPLVVARDCAVMIVAAYVAWRRDWGAFGRLVPRLPGKLATGFQFALIATLLLWPGTPLGILVFALCVLVSLAAGADYLALFVEALREDRAANG